MPATTKKLNLSTEEKGLMRLIVDNRHEDDAGRPGITRVERICPNKKSRIILKDLCGKGLAATSTGDTVAGEPYTDCWLTKRGEAVYRIL
ncbi:MAG: hypothetical protein MUC76_08425 [Spirochaetes bacterium]|jgi:hypothetical protein|nr:hypothetical protein [Spirochaetota bacterium]